MTAFNGDDGFVYTAPVGKFKPNAWGLYDMIGNALEWCSDYYGEYPDGAAVDPKGPTKGDKIGARVLRGGSWYNRPQDIRLGFRHSHAANYQLNWFPFSPGSSVTRIIRGKRRSVCRSYKGHQAGVPLVAGVDADVSSMEACTRGKVYGLFAAKIWLKSQIGVVGFA